MLHIHTYTHTHTHTQLWLLYNKNMWAKAFLRHSYSKIFVMKHEIKSKKLTPSMISVSTFCWRRRLKQSTEPCITEWKMADWPFWNWKLI